MLLKPRLQKASYQEKTEKSNMTLYFTFMLSLSVFFDAATFLLLSDTNNANKAYYICPWNAPSPLPFPH